MNEKIERIKTIIREREEMIADEADKNDHASGLKNGEADELINFLNLFKK